MADPNEQVKEIFENFIASVDKFNENNDYTDDFYKLELKRDEGTKTAHQQLEALQKAGAITEDELKSLKNVVSILINYAKQGLSSKDLRVMYTPSIKFVGMKPSKPIRVAEKKVETPVDWNIINQKIDVAIPNLEIQPKPKTNSYRNVMSGLFFMQKQKQEQIAQNEMEKIQERNMIIRDIKQARNTQNPEAVLKALIKAIHHIETKEKAINSPLIGPLKQAVSEVLQQAPYLTRDINRISREVKDIRNNKVDFNYSYNMIDNLKPQEPTMTRSPSSKSLR